MTRAARNVQRLAAKRSQTNNWAPTQYTFGDQTRVVKAMLQYLHSNPQETTT